MRLRDLQALAVDFDRTLTDAQLRPAPEAIHALHRARRAGRKIVVVSGRTLAFLEREVGEAADALVGENGCFLLHAGRTRTLGPEVDLTVLDTLGIAIERGAVLASADLAHEKQLRDALASAGIDAHLVRNRDRVMALPRGVDKAAGVLAALDALGIPPERAAAAGDGENDLVMLEAVGYAIAVANAVPELKAIADHVTGDEGGVGLASWIEEQWLPALGREAAA